jgi:hypothetical protein
MPALSAIVRFSSTACAVSAMIGVVTPISRISRTVVIPSITTVSIIWIEDGKYYTPMTGISKSNNMMSYLSREDEFVDPLLSLFTATKPFDATSTVYPILTN